MSKEQEILTYFLYESKNSQVEICIYMFRFLLRATHRESLTDTIKRKIF